jgi:protein phosphatase
MREDIDVNQARKERRKDPTLRLLAATLGKEATTATRADTAVPPIAACTDPGCVRARNEDNYLVAQLQPTMHVVSASLGVGVPCVKGPSGLLLAVADGVGGVPGGEVASAVTLDAVAESFLASPQFDPMRDREELGASLHLALEASQRRLRRVATRKGLDARIATTLTVAYVAWPRLVVLHVGDSRAYLFREGRLSRLTRDQTAAQDLMEAGVIPQSARGHTPFEHILTSAVGGSSAAFRLDVQETSLQPDDAVLLCTDGLYNELSDELLCGHIDRLGHGLSVYDVVDAMVQDAKDRGGRDNLTAVLARFP